VRAHLLGDLGQLGVGETVEVLGAVDAMQKRDGLEVRVAMKSVICSSSGAPAGAACASDARAWRCDRSASSRAPFNPNSVT
jgi:hypothetical protein